MHLLVLPAVEALQQLSFYTYVSFCCMSMVVSLAHCQSLLWVQAQLAEGSASVYPQDTAI